MDIADTLAPNSDQLDAIELVAGPRTFTIERVSKGDPEQPVQVHLAEFPRPWRPGKSMRRVLAACWGTDASQWVGRRVELFFDPEVTFGKDKPGGTRISRLSHIDKRKSIPLLVTRGKSAMYVVEPLPDVPTSSTITQQQTARMTELFTAAGIERSARIGYCSMTIGRDITKPSDLSEHEAASIIGALEDIVDPPSGLDEFRPDRTSVPVVPADEPLLGGAE